MTPEERWKRIDELFEGLLIDRADHERMIKRLDRLIEQHDRGIEDLKTGYEGLKRALEFLASSQASLNEAMRHLVKTVEDHQRDGHGGQAGEKQ